MSRKKLETETEKQAPKKRTPPPTQHKTPAKPHPKKQKTHKPFAKKEG